MARNESESSDSDIEDESLLGQKLTMLGTKQSEKIGIEGDLLKVDMSNDEQSSTLGDGPIIGNRTSKSLSMAPGTNPEFKKHNSQPWEYQNNKSSKTMLPGEY